MARRLIYVAGPYTHPDPVENTHATCRVAMAIYERTEWCPVVPHLSLLWHAVVPRPERHWLDYDLHLLRACDAIVRLPGFSRGADGEMQEAERIGLPVVQFDDLPREAIAAWRPRRDVTERLREASTFALMSAARETVVEAANEIDRLRSEVSLLRSYK
jgi:hypothetical protein